MKKILQSKWIAPLFVLINFFLYFPTRNAKFTSDFYSLVGQFEEYGAKGLLTGFDDTGLHPVFFSTLFILYRLFDLNNLIWFLLFIPLHGLNAFMVFKVFGRMLQNVAIEKGPAIAFVAALFFLVSPYQTEAVVWAATIHYLICVALCLICTGLVVKYFESSTERPRSQSLPLNSKEHLRSRPATKHYMAMAILSFVCFMIALYALEIALMLPFILIAFLAFMYFNTFSFRKILNAFGIFVLPQFVGIFLYFLHSRMKFGQWIGHYGADTHLNFSPEMVGTNLNLYLLKFTTFFRYIPVTEKNHVFKAASEPVFAFGILILIGLLILFSLGLIFLNKKSTQNKTKLKVVLVFFFTFIAALWPVINLETTSLIDIQSDRYGYFASIFFYLLLSSLLFFLAKRVVWTLSFFWIAASIFLLVETNKNWKIAGIVGKGLIENYKWFEARKIYVLNVPDNVGGAYLFRNGFRESIEKHHNRKVEARVIRAVWYNWQEVEDCVAVKTLGPNQVTATLMDPRKWWIYYGAGANSYDKETQKFEMKGRSYTLTFKDFDPQQDLVIYPCGTDWIRMEF